MVIRGIVKDGVVVLDDEISLPDGTVVNVETVPEKDAANGDDLSRLERMKRAAGSWADADDDAFAQWLEETFQARKIERREPPA